ncbi:hypothetical protein N8067_02760 [Planktomarina temperata]|nr:hypothetical protein [Planktomarina temperata]
MFKNRAAAFASSRAGPLSAYGLVADPDLATTQAAVSNETAMGSN